MRREIAMEKAKQRELGMLSKSAESVERVLESTKKHDTLLEHEAAAEQKKLAEEVAQIRAQLEHENKIKEDLLRAHQADAAEERKITDLEQREKSVLSQLSQKEKEEAQDRAKLAHDNAELAALEHQLMEKNAQLHKAPAQPKKVDTAHTHH